MSQAGPYVVGDAPGVGGWAGADASAFVGASAEVAAEVMGDVAAEVMAGVGRRMLAWLVDFALVLATATLVVIVTMHRIGLLLTNVPSLAGESAWQLVKSHGHLVGAAEGLGRSLWHSALSDVQQGLGALVLLTFAYQFGALALSGRTLGKALLRLRVGDWREPGVLGRRRAAVRAAVTTVADIGCFALACSLLVGGSFLLAALCWALAVALLWANAVPALLGVRRSLADRLAGTGVRGARRVTPAVGDRR